MRRLATMTLTLIVVVNCGGDKALPPPPVTAGKTKKDAAANNPTAASAPVQEYHYSSVGKRDPFRPYYFDEQQDESQKVDEHLTELQRYEVDQLKLVAILSGTSQPEAMFEDPKGVGWPVTVGTPIGRNGGRVYKIKKDEVVILEEYRDGSGKKVMNPLSVKLPGDELVMDK